MLPVTMVFSAELSLSLYAGSFIVHTWFLHFLSRGSSPVPFAQIHTQAVPLAGLQHKRMRNTLSSTLCSVLAFTLNTVLVLVYRN